MRQSSELVDTIRMDFGCGVQEEREENDGDDAEADNDMAEEESMNDTGIPPPRIARNRSPVATSQILIVSDGMNLAAAARAAGPAPRLGSDK